MITSCFKNSLIHTFVDVVADEQNERNEIQKIHLANEK